MDAFTSQITFVISALAVLGQIFVLFVIIAFFLSKDTLTKISGRFSPEKWLAFSFVVAAFATFGSLYYSEIVGLVPCKLCWFQRIFLYPQAILLAVALFKRDFSVVHYVVPLSLIGAVFSFVHYYEQMSGSDLFSCSTAGVSCAKVYFTEFGYITFSLLGLTAFLMILTATALASKAFRVSKLAQNSQKGKEKV